MIVCFAAVFSVSAFAANIDDYAFIADDGSMQYDMDAYHYAVAQEMVLESGVDIDPAFYFLRDPVSGDFCGYDFNSFLNDYDFAVAAMNPPAVSENVEPLEPIAPPLEVETEFEVESDRAVLSDVLEDDEAVSVQNVEVIEPHRYVVEDLRNPNSNTFIFDYGKDSPISNNGNLIKVADFSPPFDLLNSASVSMIYCDEVLASAIPFADIFIESTDNYYFTSFFVFALSDCNIYDLDFEPGIYFPSSEVLAEEDLDPSLLKLSITVPDYDFRGDLMAGTLKSLVVSIFGEYTPVNTTALLMETVDNETTTTLVDVVASGMAGVDWEWCAGVFLFGIMLYCLFKLLGGILS